MSASAVVIHYEEALYQVYAPLPLSALKCVPGIDQSFVNLYASDHTDCFYKWKKEERKEKFNTHTPNSKPKFFYIANGIRTKCLRTKCHCGFWNKINCQGRRRQFSQPPVHLTSLLRGYIWNWITALGLRNLEGWRYHVEDEVWRYLMPFG